jgi:hypothetical protein
MIIYQCDMMEYNADLVFQCPQSFGVPFPSHFTNCFPSLQTQSFQAYWCRIVSLDHCNSWLWVLV